MSNNILNKRTFKALMAYLNPIGSIGGNVDMWGNEIEYFPTVWASNETFRFKLIEVFQKFLYELITKFGNELYEGTDGKDSVYWVDTTINPKTREIILTPKYYTYGEIKDKRHFGWRELTNSHQLSEFMEDMETNELIIDYDGHESGFDEVLTYKDKNNKEHQVSYFRYSIFEMISEILENDNWNGEGGGHGTMKLYDDNSGYLYHTWIEKKATSGEPIILKEEDFD